jgi:hypothetical protein
MNFQGARRGHHNALQEVLVSFLSIHFFITFEERLDVKMTIFIYSFILVTCKYNDAILSRLDKLGEL